MKTILAAIDFSPVTDRVCASAVNLAKAVNARVVLLHSVQPFLITSEYGPMIENIAEITEAGEQAAERELARLKKKVERQLVVTDTVQLFGIAAPLILEQAKKLSADYIVLGSHGHTAVYDLFVGSTTHRVLMKARCPVMVVPAAPARKPRKRA